MTSFEVDSSLAISGKKRDFLYNVQAKLPEVPDDGGDRSWLAHTPAF
jgi:hypothetical protein